MAGSHTSLIVMPIVIAVALAFWISLVYRASFHPRWRHHARPQRTEVAGGVFEATHSARQLEPLWAEPVEAIPQPREAAFREGYRAGDAAGAQTAEQEHMASRAGAGSSFAGAGARSGATATGSVAPGSPVTGPQVTGSRVSRSGPPAESGPAESGSTGPHVPGPRATGSRPPTESGPTGSGWPPE